LASVTVELQILKRYSPNHSPLRLSNRVSSATRALLGRSFEAGGGGPRRLAISSLAQPAQQVLAQRQFISQRAAWLTANAPLA
jgi:hypothetical protein